MTQSIATDGRRGEEAVGLEGLTAWRVIQATFKIGEHDVGRSDFRADARKGPCCVIDIHQVDIACQDHLCHAH